MPKSYAQATPAPSSERDAVSTIRTSCRISRKPLTAVADFGNLYVSNFLESVNPDALRSELCLGIGEESGLLQLAHTVDRDLLYRHYWYVSGTNATMTGQLADVVKGVSEWVKLNDGDVVLDIGCNDGTLLRQYPPEVKLVKVGIDPAVNLAKLGRAQCDRHAADYFTREVFFSLTGGRKAKAITSIAMFYDLEDPSGFVADIGDCLADDGVWVVQMSYMPLMLVQNAFDNVIHEHLEYYSLLSIDYLVRKHDLKILDVEFNDTNGGSFRVTLSKQGNPLREAPIFRRDIGHYRYKSILEYERRMRFDDQQVCLDFMARVEELRSRTLDLLTKLKRQGKRVFGYGASTKGNTLLQYYGIGPELIEGIAERQPQKYGLLCAGSWIPIMSEEHMRAERPDYLFVLPWHFINEFLQREREYLNSGGKLIVPLPELMVIGE
jgi:cyclopropane fatty-acyl-phospholipid synthase-like methyltransferase